MDRRGKIKSSPKFRFSLVSALSPRKLVRKLESKLVPENSSNKSTKTTSIYQTMPTPTPNQSLNLFDNTANDHAITPNPPTTDNGVDPSPIAVEGIPAAQIEPSGRILESEMV